MFRVPARIPLDPEHPGRYSSSLVAGLAMLECFSSERSKRGIADMAEELGLGRSTTHRYASTLVRLGYLEQGSSRKYWLSARTANIGYALLGSIPVRQAARGHLRALRSQTGHTVALAVLEGSEVVYVDCLRGSGQGQYAIDVGIGPGIRRPVYCTAAGKGLLASLPAAEQNELIIKLKLRRRGPNTLTTKGALRAELERIATNCEAVVEDEELLVGRRALGAAVLDGECLPVAAVEFVAPAGALTREELLANFAFSVLAAAERIGRDLQGLGRDEPAQATTGAARGGLIRGVACEG